MAPQLDIDGFSLAETNAIVHYMGKMGKIRYEENEEAKAKLKKDLETTIAPQFFGTMIKFLAANGGSHLVGDSLTYADLLLACLLDGIYLYAPEAAEKFPKQIVAFKDSITGLPAISSWIKQRPQTEF